MKSAVIKRSVVIDHHKTSVSLEDEFWQGVKDIAAERNIPVADLVGEIDKDCGNGNLSSAIRLAVFKHFDRRSV